MAREGSHEDKNWKDRLVAFSPWIPIVEAVFGGVVWFLSHVFHVNIQQFLSWPIGSYVKWAMAVQAATILGLMLAVPKFWTSDPNPPNEVQASNQFLEFWFGAWASWLLLYFLLVIIAFGLLDNYPETTHVARDAFNLYNACCLLLCYASMVSNSTGDDLPRFRFIRKTFLCGAAALVLVEAISAASFASNQQTVETIHLYFDSFNGIISGIAIALLVSRFAGGIINAPIVLLVPLFAYANIQIMFPIIDSKQILFLAGNSKAEFTLAILTGAFLGKLVMFWQVYTLYSSGRLVSYMATHRILFPEKPLLVRSPPATLPAAGLKVAADTVGE